MARAEKRLVMPGSRHMGNCDTAYGVRSVIGWRTLCWLL